MLSKSSDHDRVARSHARRIRVDDLATIAARNQAGSPGPTPSHVLPAGHSGRRTVIIAGLVIVALWASLYLIFREWRTRYRERAAYGATHVVPAIDPMRGIMPPGIALGAWRDAVDQTRAMLLTVTGSNLLDIADMDRLQVELAEHARRAASHPKTAVNELAQIWDEAADRGEFLFRDSRSRDGTRHPRPRILPARSREKPSVKSSVPTQ